MAIDFEKVNQHLEHTLSLELSGEVVMTIKPKIGKKSEFVKIIKDMSKTTETDKVEKFLYDLILEVEVNLTDEHKNSLKVLIGDNINEFLDQLLIGFKVSTRKELDDAVKDYKDKKLGKNE